MSADLVAVPQAGLVVTVEPPDRPVALAPAVAPVSVLVVDHQVVFAEALAARLTLEPDLEVTAVSRAAHALAVVPARRVQVVLLEHWLADVDGVELARRLSRLERPPAVVFLGDTDRPAAVVEALRHGVRAWVGKDSPVELLLQAVRAVVRGDMWLTPGLLGPVVQLLLDEGGRPPASRLDALTARELDVLRCMVDGLDQTAIAQRLFLSPNTVRTHRRRTFAKLGVHSSLEAVAEARRAGLGPGASTPRDAR